MKCYWKAHCVGDIEGGIALYQLATLYEKSNDPEQAAAAYYQYIQDSDQQGIGDNDQQGKAYRFLANFFIEKGQYEDAYEYAQKCTEFADMREDGKSFLKEIASRRGHGQVWTGDPTETPGPGANGNAPVPPTSIRANLEPMNLTFTP